MKVYHFMAKSFALQNLEKSRLKVATLDNLNDPYEFFPNVSGASNEDLENFRHHYDGILGFLCFSKKLGDPVQWAHYAQNHSGICFEFEIPRKYLQKIKYVDSPVYISRNSARWKEQIPSVILCKYKSWRYEREYRVSLDLRSEEVQKENELFFVPFPEELKLVKAYSGLRSELTQEERDLFSKHGIPLTKMTQKPKSYTLVPET
ncbi:DUF2971 domain-containing protein [Vibrio cholerae]|uniref:DUF2971 domain-containing protein n=1 Tax=Vibrio cholerae TaxID=666 RepID=UPI00187F82E1|nr:DUF2971 domain-containing protein [Vibrio cholerae]MBF8947203.1 DUF2971 domain-containing protein [Vibrio cholerae]MBF8954880.1 DUF2971 domain-containing protein [Vibrio cholerae]MBF8958404.1 DUF2971 domain-containing protein [Vibrio cholerae]MBF8966163.1 DUF2971 domain-containing protein [Vibrio cholerae]MBF8972168.1 DUF2971 domain-containing protein [Vibrio cholerae]